MSGEWGRGIAIFWHKMPLLDIMDANDVEQSRLSCTRYQMIHQSVEGILPARAAQPGGHQSSTQDQRQAGEFASQQAEQGKSAEGLAEIIH